MWAKGGAVGREVPGGGGGGSTPTEGQTLALLTPQCAVGAASKRLELMVVTSPPKHVIDTETVTVIPDARQSPPTGVVAASNKRGPPLSSLWPIPRWNSKEAMD